MQQPAPVKWLPTHILVLTAVYCAASLLHFTHNAEYIGHYPSMPAWISRGDVYLTWLVITATGLAGIALSFLGWAATGAVLLAVYGALGLDGLGHYALALPSEHTLAMNFTILFEVFAGIVLAICSAFFFQRQAGSRRVSKT